MLDTSHHTATDLWVSSRCIGTSSQPFLTHRFCAAHPHPEYGWVYSFTPHDGFKANSRAYANTLVTCAALGLIKCDLKSARKAATDSIKALTSERRAAAAKDAQDAARKAAQDAAQVKTSNKVLAKLPGFRKATISLMNKFIIEPTAKKQRRIPGCI